MTRQLQIKTMAVRDDGQRLALDVKLHNPMDRTLYAYSTVRALRYDPSTRILEVQLSDLRLSERANQGSFLVPRFLAVDAGSDGSLELSVPRVIARLGGGSNHVSAPIERLAAHEAEHVDVEIAWSGTPYYADARGKLGPRAALVAWAQGHARSRHTRSKATRPPR